MLETRRSRAGEDVYCGRCDATVIVGADGVCPWCQTPTEREAPEEISLRAWQARLVERLRGHPEENFLVVACAGAGKTIGAGGALADAMAERELDQLIVVCPTVTLRRQWAKELRRLGYRMDAGFENKMGAWPGRLHGVVVTYQQVARRPEVYRHACRARSTAVILDEIHHAADARSWGSALASGFELAKLRVGLSATPFRSDADAIPFVSYDEKGRCRPHFRYGYLAALADQICRPVEFHRLGGTVRWRDGSGSHEAAFADRIEAGERGRRLRAALAPETGFVDELLERAHEHLAAQRERIPDAGGLVLAQDQEHARRLARRLERISGEAPELAVSDDPSAHRAIARYAESDRAWIVAVRMVSEGVDIQRLTTLAWATNATTELFFRQAIGRIARSREEDPDGLDAAAVIPDDPKLVGYAERLTKEPIPPTYERRRTSGEGPGEFPGGRGRREFRGVGSDPRPAGRIPAMRPEGRRAEPAAGPPPAPPEPRTKGPAVVTADGPVGSLLEAEAEATRLVRVYELVRRHARPGEDGDPVRREVQEALGKPSLALADADELAALIEHLNTEIRAAAETHPRAARNGLLEARARGLVARRDKRAAASKPRPRPALKPAPEIAALKAEAQATNGERLSAPALVSLGEVMARFEIEQQGTCFARLGRSNEECPSCGGRKGKQAVLCRSCRKAIGVARDGAKGKTPISAEAVARKVSEEQLVDVRRRYEAGATLTAIAREIVEETGYEKPETLATILGEVFRSRAWPLRARGAHMRKITDELLEKARRLYQDEGMSFPQVGRALLEESGCVSAETLASNLCRHFKRRGWATRDRIEATVAASFKHGLKTRATQKGYAAYRRRQRGAQKPRCKGIVRQGERKGERCLITSSRDGYCWRHHPDNAAEVKRAARAMGEGSMDELTVPLEPVRLWLLELYERLGEWQLVADVVGDRRQSVYNRAKPREGRASGRVMRTVVERWLASARAAGHRVSFEDLYGANGRPHLAAVDADGEAAEFCWPCRAYVTPVGGRCPGCEDPMRSAPAKGAAPARGRPAYLDRRLEVRRAAMERFAATGELLEAGRAIAKSGPWSSAQSAADAFEALIRREGWGDAGGVSRALASGRWRISTPRSRPSVRRVFDEALIREAAWLYYYEAIGLTGIAERLLARSNTTKLTSLKQALIDEWRARRWPRRDRSEEADDGATVTPLVKDADSEPDAAALRRAA